MKKYLVEGREKSLIHVKNPILMLPEINISNRVVSYIKTYNELQPYIEAFLKNVTNEKLKTYYKNNRNFLSNPDIYILKVTNILVGMEDSYLDVALLNRARIMR